MTDHEKDREAVEWMANEVRRAIANGSEDECQRSRRILALAREALAMRGKGVWAYWVEGSMASDGICGEHADAVMERDQFHPGARIIPLYAGEPVQVDDE